jgi:nitroreductase
MNLEETIYKRQSIRNYKEEYLTDDELGKLRKFIENVKVLNDNIIWSYDIVTKEEIKTILNWKAPHYLLIFSEQKENYLENVGFIFQQVDLFLQSKGIGSCWIGMASPKSYENGDTNQKFIITISFGKTEENIGRELNEFKRNKLSQICDSEDEKLIYAQLAPSATNSQPWYFTHNDDGSYNIYRKKFNILKRRFTEKWNRIDIGIALAHLYVANENTFKFSIESNPKELDGYYYEGSFEL